MLQIQLVLEYLPHFQLLFLVLITQPTNYSQFRT